ncbi:MAG: redoxin domain-containing protein [Candidatus Diapherotrites archaeon]|nr:redoxin domain-containing protein [Candidatus Diapherotrites archaeon]
MDDKAHKILLAAAVVLIIAAILFLKNPFVQEPPVLPQTQENESPERKEEPSPYPVAPEIIGIQGWINSEPLTLASLRGKVVLVDFWTYSCINCIRTLPYLKQWHEKYSDMGFVLIGVHSPEFDFEKKPENVQMAANEFSLTYPIALDSDMETWRNYKNRFWPAKYLIDAEGRIRYTHFGEGAYEETEQKIQELLEEAMQKEIDVELTKEEEKSGEAGFFRTREIYAGHSFGVDYLGNPEGFSIEKTGAYTDTPEHVDGKMYLHGEWAHYPEFVKHARTTTAPEDYIAVKYLASEVNIVAGKGTQPYKIYITLDGVDLTDRYAGKDIQFTEEGKAFIEVLENKLYNVVNGPLGIRELKLYSDSNEFSLYTFTFGG